VDIDQALSGIDRLLKSQELTFAFVGVAPALAIVWVVVGGLGRMWSVNRGRGSWGGRKKRRGVWERMRFVWTCLYQLRTLLTLFIGELKDYSSCNNQRLTPALLNLHLYQLDY
jgi:hypothetical protein